MLDVEQASQSPCCGGLIKVIAAIGLVLCAGGLAYAFWPANGTAEAMPLMGGAEVNGGRPVQGEAPVAGADDTTKTADTRTEAEIEDDRLRAGIVGDWETDRDAGHRDLTVNADGTAKMFVKITNFTRYLFGSEMEIDIKWHIKNGDLHFKMVGGKPAKSVAALTKAYGDKIAYPILELTDNRLLVKDGADDPDHDWSRVTK